MNADNPAVIMRAYDLGIRHFDTAWAYQNGRNEEMIGKVLSENGFGNDIVLATKTELGLGNTSFFFLKDYEELKQKHGKETDQKLTEAFLERFETSLRRLQRKCVDILYVHSVADPELIELPFVLEILAKLKREGKIRFAGISVHRREAEIVNKAAEMKFYDAVLVPINFKRENREAILKSMKNAHDNGIATIAMKTQAVWGGKTKETHHTASLKWVMQHDFIDTSIPGVTTFEQLEEDFSVAKNVSFTDEEERYILDYWRTEIGSVERPCQQCERCLATCPKKTDIPELMRTYMYAAGYQNFEQSRITYERIPAERNLSNCADCRRCTARCHYGLEIVSNIRQLKAIFDYA